MTFRPKTWTNLGLIAAAGLAASACTYDGYEPYPYGHGRHDGGGDQAEARPGLGSIGHVALR